MYKQLSLIGFLALATNPIFAQNPEPPDSMMKMTAGYLLIEKGGNPPHNLEATVQDISIQQRMLTAAVAKTEGSVNTIEQQLRVEKEAKYKKRLRKVLQGPEFVKAAHTSLSALLLSNTLTDYLSDVGALSNPENAELGLSLQTTVVKIIDDKIFHGKPKVGKQKRQRFLEVVGHVIKSPLVTGITSAIPVVNSLGTITDMVSSMASNNDEVSMEDYEAYKKEIAAYVAFYQSLGQAGAQFDAKINNLGLRSNVLENLLRNFTLERSEILYPQLSAGGSPMEMNELIRNYYDKDAIAKIIDQIEQEAMIPDQGVWDFDKLLNDPRLAFPDFAINQARYISDELQTLSKEYLSAFQQYQSTVERILNDAPTIVSPEKAQVKINSLREKLALMEKTYHSAIHVEELQKRFEKLIGLTNP